MQSWQEVEINGEIYNAIMVRAPTRHAYAKMDGNKMVIKVPLGLSEKEAYEIFEELKNKFARHLNKIGYKRPIELSFTDGQIFKVLDHNFAVRVGKIVSGKIKAKVINRNGAGELYIIIPENYEESSKKVREAARKALSKALLPELEKRVQDINAQHFNFALKNVRISKDGKSRWGSCNARTMRININFRLLFAPDEILNYVIIHELAHLKERNHGKKFWALVKSADPIYKEHAKWLLANGNSILPDYNIPKS